MRSLNRSLPSTPPNRPAPPEQLLQAFRQAALSVTNLYKSAASDHDQIRQAGYQDAIDDLLKFLDRENLGVQDGEGWRIRQWATAKYDGSHFQQGEDEEDETAENEQEYASSSPEKHTEEDPRSVQQEQEPSKPTQPQDQNHTQRSQSQPPPGPIFHFSAGSTDNAMQTDDTQTLPSSSQEQQTPPLRVEVINRGNRNATKQNSRHQIQHASRSTTRTPSTTAGSKRKWPFPDIAELFNVNLDRKDSFDGGSGGGGGGGGNGSGGSKRSRFV